MMKKILCYLVLFAIVFSIDNAVAASLGEVSRNLYAPTRGLGRILNAICYILGVGFILGGFLQYKFHRENPQQIRISTPITLWILGVAMIALPFIAMMSESGKFVR